MKQCLAIIFVALLLMSGCSDDSSTAETSRLNTWDEVTVPPRSYDAAVVEQGRVLYQRHCAECHGTRAEGNPEWRKRLPNGRFPPPPLNGSGHAWHHPWQLLHQIVKYGGKPGQSDMPAWEGKLTDAEIDAILSWTQSLWPQSIYETWYQVDQRAQ